MKKIRINVVGDDYARAKADFDKAFLKIVLEKYKFNIAETARKTGISRPTIYKYLEIFNKKSGM